MLTIGNMAAADPPVRQAEAIARQAVKGMLTFGNAPMTPGNALDTRAAGDTIGGQQRRRFGSHPQGVGSSWPI